MPISGAKPPKKTMPAPPPMPVPTYPQAGDLSPEELDALLAEGYADYGDGELIPPMPRGGGKAVPPGMQPGTYTNPGLNVANPGANAGGGPTGMQSDIRSDIFQNLYRSGKQSGNTALMDMGRPPMQPNGMPEMPVPPWEQEAPAPPLMGPPITTPPPMDQWPPHLQAGMANAPQPGRDAMARRFPRATSLIPGGAGGYRGRTR